jgi:hypothetical protein
MYYYIFDIKKCKKRSQVENIKNYLASLGISGEFTFPSAAQTVDELVDLGLSKEYSTIVAIGGDEIANQVAGKLVGKREAMGYIPLEVDSQVNTIIGAKTWKEACDILRFRKISEMRIGKTATGCGFITSAKLEINNPVEVTLEFKDYIVQASVKSLIISNYTEGFRKIGDDFLDIIMVSASPQESTLMSSISRFFGQKQLGDKKASSLFRARSLRIFTKNQISIFSGNASIAKTPQLIESSDEKLRLITARNALSQ